MYTRLTYVIHSNSIILYEWKKNGLSELLAYPCVCVCSASAGDHIIVNP